MQESGMITVFLGIMAVCMVIMTVIVVVAGLEVYKTLQHLQTFITHTDKKVTRLLRKGKLNLDELYELTHYLHTQTKAFTSKASNGIAKMTLVSLLVKAVSAIVQKSHSSKDQS